MPPATRTEVPARARRLLRRLGEERGISMIEVTIALVLLAIVGGAMITLLTSATAATRIARQRTIAQQAALGQIEVIRAMDYKDVGIVAGNPAGCLGVTSPTTACPGSSYPAATVNVNNGGLLATLTTQVSYVNDPGPLSYSSYASYKKITVIVTRNSDSSQLAKEVTYVAPPVKASQSNAVINARVIDIGPNSSPQMASVPVSLSTGPSAPRNDVTDASGAVIFAGLTPNPTSGATAYYDLSLTTPTGYVTLYDTVSPAAPAHVQLSPGQTWTTALYVYKPATIYVDLKNYDGTPYTGSGTSATVSYTRNSTAYSKAFSYTGSTLSVTSMTEGAKTVQTIPGLPYTVSVAGGPFYYKDTTATPQNSQTANVPDNGYPSVLTHTFTFTNAQLATVTVNVQRGATLCNNSTVTVTGGPFSGAPWNFSASATTVNGLATIPNVPVGSGYTIKATRSSGATVTSTTTTVSAPTTQAMPTPLSFGATSGSC
jgi:type II secretory pathway pseudopilin PulG